MANTAAIVQYSGLKYSDDDSDARWLAKLLAVQNLMARNHGRSLSANAVRRLTPEAVAQLLPDPNLALAVQSTLLAMRGQEAAIDLLERQVCAQVKLRPAYRHLLSVSGIGKVLGLIILLETGAVGRFARVGNYVSYCRCVGSERLSNGKHKGRGNTKNGNKYLAWAYIEAANFAVRFNPTIKRYYQRKRA